MPAPTLLSGGSRFRWRGAAGAPGGAGRAQRARTPPAALEAARLAGADDRRARSRAWRDFRGAGRRFQLLGQQRARGARVRRLRPSPDRGRGDARRRAHARAERLVAVFQPHLYSRTALLAREFGAALARADVVVVLDVYPARERAEDFPGVSGLPIAEAAADAARGPAGLLAAGLRRGRRRCSTALLGDGDLCLVMGAGDVDALGRRLVAA